MKPADSHHDRGTGGGQVRGHTIAGRLRQGRHPLQIGPVDLGQGDPPKAGP
jgi:hypothetical protein